jgi:hypothetical protein
MLAIDDGWSRVLQACKGNGSTMQFNIDKKGSLKAKKDKSMVFGLYLL